MKNLTGKTISLEDKKFKVKVHEIFMDEEVIVLSYKPTTAIKEILTIQDLGYSTAKNIQYPDDLMRNAKQELSEVPQNQNPSIKIAFADDSGKLHEKSVIVFGLDFLDPTLVKISIDGSHDSIKLDELCLSRLLYIEWKKPKPKTASKEKDKSATNEDFRKMIHNLIEDLIEGK